jgi:hypothetical protein
MSYEAGELMVQMAVGDETEGSSYNMVHIVIFSKMRFENFHLSRCTSMIRSFEERAGRMTLRLSALSLTHD